MQTKTLAEAQPYVAPKHNACVSYRLQGLEATAVKDFWVGLSHFLPGGGADLDASPFEKVYIMLEGELTVEASGSRITLRKHDSCVIPAHEARVVLNESKLPASMVVILSTHKEHA